LLGNPGLLELLPQPTARQAHGVAHHQPSLAGRRCLDGPLQVQQGKLARFGRHRCLRARMALQAVLDGLPDGRAVRSRARPVRELEVAVLAQHFAQLHSGGIAVAPFDRDGLSGMAIAVAAGAGPQHEFSHALNDALGRLQRVFGVELGVAALALLLVDEPQLLVGAIQIAQRLVVDVAVQPVRLDLAPVVGGFAAQAAHEVVSKNAMP